MSPRRQWLTLCIFALGVLAGCQGTPTPQDVLDVESPQAMHARRAAEHAAKPQETFGSGATRIALITALMSPTGETVRERDIRDGASLAVDEVGGGQLSLLVENTDGSPQQIQDAAKRLAGQNVALVAVSVADVPVSTVRQGLGNARAPLLVLRDNGAERPTGTFAFVSDRIDSAVEGASYAVASGHKRLVVLLPSDASAAERQRLERELAGYGIKPALVAVTGTTAFSANVATKAKLKDVDAVILVGAGVSDVGALSQLKANGYLKPNAMVVGSSGWSAAAYRRPELSGSHLCLFGPENGSRMTSRYLDRYERAASPDAAYGFDIIALAAGLVRTQGEDAINQENIRSPNGFIGAAAAFRFEKNGTVRRTCAIHQVTGGSVKLLDPAPRSF
ncbi:ABC transporter substrate-binding protein [Ensifer sp. T173]|uniref:ABC transporter substrate-binding protein n=1 Tax=Ensifer canadensis TaxID=555315 RepID=A0AAW4FUR4_9HYPH|nr:ABC transporter substrate-binding protein [Ensifer canadensis]MBM3095093.1 ABC transporter substrate-binding protein [Ensifer canadensis]UBI80625.1 ABC transporter substrate-binding protein [Ensifer canadensis]